jgi:hypothetical protein
MSASHHPSIIDRIVEPLDRTMKPEVARWLVALRAGSDLQQRYDELADRNTAGVLSPDELAEYDEYLLLAQFVATLQARARTVLSSANGS